MRVLIVYGTTEGHTRALARFVAEHLKAARHDVTLYDAADGPPPDPAAFDAAILAGSLHIGHYQASLVHFARHWREALNAMPSAFISVSLAAASESADDLAGLAKCLDGFEAQTGWRPAVVHQAAGAILFSAYDFFRRLAMRAIAKAHGASTTEDRDYTDYAALGRFADDFVAMASARTRGQG